MTVFLAKTLALFVLWVFLSGKFTAGHLVLGVVASSVVAWLNTGLSPSPIQQTPWIRLLTVYSPWLFIRVVKSSLHLTRLILDPSLPIAPRIIKYQTPLMGKFPVVLLGNSITLTPGTITIEANGQDMVVHAMDEESAQDVVHQEFDKKIARLFHQENNQR